MAIQIGKYNFEGPYRTPADIPALSGVYVILGRNGPTNWQVIDVGESRSLWERLNNHDREPQWGRCGYSDRAIAVLYCAEAQRMQIERELRNQFNPVCGIR